MGLQVRKRTKGKDGWLNGSYSSKGVGVSGSVKAGKNVTYNTGDLSSNRKTPSRLTVNFGNGIRWVSYGKSKKAQTNNHVPGEKNIFAIGVGIVIALFVLFVLGLMVIGLIETLLLG